MVTNPSHGLTADRETRHFGWRLGGLFVFIAAALALGGYTYLSHQQADARAEAQRELSAIADLKLRQIVNWREERLSDARFFSRARFVAQDVQRFLNEPGSEAARSEVWHWLDLLKGEERYAAVAVYDREFKPRLAIPATSAEPGASSRKLLEQAMQDRNIVFGDLRRDENDDGDEMKTK